MRSKKNLLHTSRLCVIIDSDTLGTRNAVRLTRAVVAGGADMVQVRGKKLSFAQWYPLAKAIRRVTAAAGIPLIINDRLDVTLAVNADGIHLGQGDLTAATARRCLGRQKIIGVSAATATQARRAIADGADYLGVGPVFRTPVKLRRPAGIATVQRIQRRGVPVFAIGGITIQKLPALITAGITRIAVIRAVCTARDPGNATRLLRKTLCAT